jgi:hypothetical protein
LTENGFYRKRLFFLLAYSDCLKISDAITLKNSVMKTLKEIKGVTILGKTQQQAITGGRACNEQYPCPPIACCIDGICRMNCKDL